MENVRSKTDMGRRCMAAVGMGVGIQSLQESFVHKVM